MNAITIPSRPEHRAGHREDPPVIRAIKEVVPHEEATEHPPCTADEHHSR